MMRNSSTFLGSFKTHLITGMLVLIPIGAVIAVFLWAWGLIFQLNAWLPQSLHPREWRFIEDPFALKVIDLLFPFFTLALLVVGIAFLGWISKNYLGKQMIQMVSRFVSKVPVFNVIYSTLQQLVETFSSGQMKNFRRVVQVEYPREGLFTLAFVTGEKQMRGERLLQIYVPTTPNPTSGFYLMVREKDVQETNLSVEQALKEIISMGIVH